MELEQVCDDGGGTGQKQQTQQPIEPWKVIVGAESTGQRQEIAPEVEHVLRVVPEHEGIPVGEPVGQLIKMGGKPKHKGREECDGPFRPDGTSQPGKCLLRSLHKNSFRVES